MNIFKRALTAKEVKDKARELGADLVGIADGEKVGAREKPRSSWCTGWRTPAIRR
jgi:hypothetical protein